MSDSTIRIDFSSLGSALQGVGGSGEGHSEALVKALENLNTTVKNMPSYLEKAFSK